MIPSLNWGYETVPQAVMNGKPMDYSRGKGLGGSSAINYACYSVGPKEDYDEWACLVGDHFFDWDHCVERRRRFETYTYTRNPEHDKYVAPVEAAHGASGPVKVEIAPKWEKDMAITLDALDANGWKINKDLNSGNPIGTTIVPNAASKGWRSTAAVEFLQDPPQNLTILTDSQVTKVTFEGKRATGVEVNGKICMYDRSSG